MLVYRAPDIALPLPKQYSVTNCNKLISLTLFMFCIL